MLYDLTWLSEGKPFPPKSEEARLKKYRDNEIIFQNDSWALNHDVFAEAAQRITRVIGNFESFISFPVLFNFQRLLSLKTADLVAGEYPTISGKDEEENKLINTIRNSVDFDNNLYATILDLSIFGDAVWRIYKDVDGKNSYCNWRPCEWFPIVSKDGAYLEIKQCLAWPVVINEDTNEYELHVQIHEKGFYTFYRYQLTGVSTVDGHRVYLPGTIGTKLEETVVKTGLKDNAVKHLRPYKVTGRIYGEDDYTPITSIVLELMVRISQISNILDKHADPSITGPASMLRPNPTTGELEFQKGKFYAINPGEEKPEYLTWDGQLESSFKQCEFLINQLYVLSEMGAALLGANDGGSQAVSGNALRLKMVNPLAKVRRISNNLTKPVKELFVLLSSRGYKESLDFENLTVVWKDGLPNDPREQVELIKLETGEEKIMPLKDALVQHLNLSPAEADRWLKYLNEPGSVNSSVSPSTEDEDTNASSGPGSKTGVNPQKKGSILEPHLTGTQNTKSPRDGR